MAAARESTSLQWRLRVFSPVAASSRFPQATAAAAGSTSVPRMHRAERAAPPVGEKRKVSPGLAARALLTKKETLGGKNLGNERTQESLQLLRQNEAESGADLFHVADADAGPGDGPGAGASNGCSSLGGE